MKKFENLFAGILCLAMGLFCFASCDDDDPDPLQGSADVFIQGKKTDDGTKYAISAYALANYEIKSAKATAPGTNGKVYNLAATSNKQQFCFTPQAADYSAELPTKGEYTIVIESTNTEQVTVKDALGDEKLAQILIKTATMGSSKLKTTWDKVESADAYIVKLYTENQNELIFSSGLLASDKVEYEFGATSNGWASGKSPAVNTNYVVELVGVRFETGVTVDKTSNVQFITLDSKTIKWE